MSADFTHLDNREHPRMVDVSHKAITERKAVAQAGLVDFRWHDLRHTWASWHVQAGTPLHALQEMGGWSTMEMVQRYAHLSAAHLVDHAERIATHSSQSWHKDGAESPAHAPSP